MASQILFVGHNAGYTGAPIVFLNFLKWFKKNCDIPFQIILRRGGLLEGAFMSLAPVVTLDNGYIGFIERRLSFFGLEKIAEKIYQTRLKEKFRSGDFGLIYSNTVTNGHVLEALRHIDCPVITHVHELEYWIRNHMGLDKFNLVKANSHYFIAVSEAVRQNLIKNHEIPEDEIEMINEFIPLVASNSVDTSFMGKRICDQLNIPSEALIVGASGTTDWRKGPDLFIEMAQRVIKRMDRLVYFLWVGG